MSVRPVAAADTFCTIMSTFAPDLRDDLEDLGGLARHVGHADDRDLRLSEIGRDSCDDRLFHLFSLLAVRQGHALAEHVGSHARTERGSGVDEHAVTAGVLDGADVQHLRAVRREFEHLLGRDDAELLRLRHDARVGGEDAVDVAVDLADIGLERRGERDGGRVRAAASERRDVAGVAVEALEAGDDHDRALVERFAQPHRGDIDDAGGAVRGIRDHARLAAGERARLEAHRVDRHRQQRHRDALAAGEQHVELARRRDRGDLRGEVEQLVGGVAHRAHGDDDFVAGAARVDDALGDPLDALRVGDGRPAVLLDDQRHVGTPGRCHCGGARVVTGRERMPRPIVHLTFAVIPPRHVTARAAPSRATRMPVDVRIGQPRAPCRRSPPASSPRSRAGSRSAGRA